LSERLQQMQAEMLERGYSVEIDARGNLPILRENNCPFSELAESDREICDLEQDVFERVLGVPMRLAHCCQDAHHCCEFEVGGGS
jgi:predicted ArsR family transcriptional regulator